jgi:hypothetical protein
MELSVDVLACLTRQWMRDDEWFNLYSWWPEGGKPPIIIYSVAGFDEIAPEGAETDRALSNGLVSALAGFYGDIGTHDRGAKDCPMAFNEDRDIKVIAGQQKFDARCRKTLKAKLSAKSDALEALLKAFA